MSDKIVDWLLEPWRALDGWLYRAYCDHPLALVFGYVSFTLGGSCLVFGFTYSALTA